MIVADDMWVWGEDTLIVGEVTFVTEEDTFVTGEDTFVTGEITFVTGEITFVTGEVTPSAKGEAMPIPGEVAFIRGEDEDAEVDGLEIKYGGCAWECAAIIMAAFCCMPGWSWRMGGVRRLDGSAAR